MPEYSQQDNKKAQLITSSIKANSIECAQVSKYHRSIKGAMIDVYDVIVGFDVNNPATAHAVKKLLASGQRGYKNIIQDLEEAIQSIKRAIEIEESGK